MSESTPGEGIGLKAAAGQLAGAALELVRTRLELASVELAEERERVQLRLALLLAGVLLVIFGLLGLGVLVAVYLWDTHRIAAVLVPALVCLVGGVALVLKARAIGDAAGIPFAATLAELDKDRAVLAAKFGGAARKDASP